MPYLIDNIIYYVDCNGNLDRITGPAVIDDDKSEFFYREGLLHRDEILGPAMIIKDKENGEILEETYYIRGRRHRVNGPAFIRYSKSLIIEQLWYSHGRISRKPDEGPAVILSNGSKYYYYLGKRIYKSATKTKRTMRKNKKYNSDSDLHGLKIPSKSNISLYKSI